MPTVKAKDLMPDLLVTIRRDATLAEAARLMLHADIGSLLVVDQQGRLLGIVTDADFAPRAPDAAVAPRSPGPRVLGEPIGSGDVEQIYHHARTRTVGDVMSRAVVTVEEDEPVARVMELMFRHRVRHIPVVRDGAPVGLVSTRDLLHLLFEDTAAVGSGRPEV